MRTENAHAFAEELRALCRKYGGFLQGWDTGSVTFVENTLGEPHDGNFAGYAVTGDQLWVCRWQLGLRHGALLPNQTGTGACAGCQPMVLCPRHERL